MKMANYLHHMERWLFCAQNVAHLLLLCIDNKHTSDYVSCQHVIQFSSCKQTNKHIFALVD